MAPSRVVKVDSGAIGAAADAIAKGFLDNEVWVWLVPRERSRLRVLRRNYRLVLRHVFVPCGTAWTNEDRSGAALWIPPERPREGRYQLLEALALLPRLRAIRRGSRLEETFEEHRPKEPHWYLSVIAVEPESQGSGAGSALMEPALALCDQQGSPAYLETNRESNLPFYRRFGFELTSRISLPGGPPIWLMWRQPA